MKIYSMTATFGKLENETLHLQPGLNVIHAPNEWGKSTWCAFLAVMLYGLDTRAKTTKAALADKERYAPWSGAAMAGRMDINWNGRDITLERWTKGRTPMGEFRVYETQSGIPVPELTAATCGESLLGVERSVFLRAGFLRLTDLPVTQDESLRRRLNALVTTGDESSDGDLLQQKLKDLKNKCRYNRSGLLPQAEAQQGELEGKLSELLSLQHQRENTQQRQGQIEERIAALQNHRLALEYEAAEENLHRAAVAREAAESAQRHAADMESACAELPAREKAEQKLEKLLSLQQRQLSLQMEAQMLPQLPPAPNAPLQFYGLDAAQAVEKANADAEAFRIGAIPAKRPFPMWIFAAAAAVLSAVLLCLRLYISGIAALAAGAVLLVVQLVQGIRAQKAAQERNDAAEAIRSRYGGGSPEAWVSSARAYAAEKTAYDAELACYQQKRQDMARSLQQLNSEILTASEGLGLPGAIDECKKVLQQYDLLADALREQQRCSAHAEALQAATKAVQKPVEGDVLTYTEAETARLLSDALFEQRQLQLRIGQYEGRMDALGSEQSIRQALQKVRCRIDRLTDTYNALERALAALEQATEELQRRFAPRIAKEAQRLFSQLTGGRYQRLTLSSDLSVNAGTAEEAVLRGAMWRSEGTVDQLYLALRLAVAKELTPDAPMVLDDALVRFDDIRLAAAMELLRQEAENKQILLFTCQSRELQA